MDQASLVPRLEYHLLKEITNGFSEDRKLGRGSYGDVYLGLHNNGQKIAVKMLRPTLRFDDAEFVKEYCNLEKLRHQNVVRLVGYCNEIKKGFTPHKGENVLAEQETHKALCFEYMQNGSLDRYLSDEFNGHDWKTRYAIIKGICKGLKYLHEESKHPIFHLDLKPANVLLDENNIPKIADFGISRPIIEKGTHDTDSRLGTLGYVPPESVTHGKITNKWDIFSLGVIILKIIAGPKGYSRSEGEEESAREKFIEEVHGNWSKRLEGISMVALELYREQVKRCIEIALTCVEVDRHKRPTIGYIINELNKTELPTNQFLDAPLNDPGSSMDQKTRQSYITEIEEKPAREKLSEPENLFGEVIDDYKLDQMGRPKTQEDRAREAWNLREDGDPCKLCRATSYVHNIVPKNWFRPAEGTLCLLYNATGNTLSYVANHDWHGKIGSTPCPKEIGNGQWAAFHHALPFPTCSMGAAVYRGKNAHGYCQDYLLAWYCPQRRFYRNKSYCEIGAVDYFQKHWEKLKKPLENSDYSSNDKSNDGQYEIEAKIGTGILPKFTAIISYRRPAISSIQPRTHQLHL